MACFAFRQKITVSYLLIAKNIAVPKRKLDEADREFLTLQPEKKKYNKHKHTGKLNRHTPLQFSDIRLMQGKQFPEKGTQNHVYTRKTKYKKPRTGERSQSHFYTGRETRPSEKSRRAFYKLTYCGRRGNPIYFLRFTVV